MTKGSRVPNGAVARKRLFIHDTASIEIIKQQSYYSAVPSTGVAEVLVSCRNSLVCAHAIHAHPEGENERRREGEKERRRECV